MATHSRETPAFAGGYRIVHQPLYNSGSAHSRFLYVKEHRDHASEASRRTLFVCNLEAGAGADDVRTAFAHFGNIELVTLGRHHGNGSSGSRFAHIIFKSAKSLQGALSAKELSHAHSARDANDLHDHSCNSRQQGLSRLLGEHTAARPARETLQLGAEAYMRAFEASEAREQAARERLSQPDDDGFVMVTRKKKGTGEEDTKKKARARPKRKRLELTNFYSHQIRETKRTQLLELRQKFEADKQRIEKMKRARKFRPD